MCHCRSHQERASCGRQHQAQLFSLRFAAQHFTKFTAAKHKRENFKICFRVCWFRLAGCGGPGCAILRCGYLHPSSSGTLSQPHSHHHFKSYSTRLMQKTNFRTHTTSQHRSRRTRRRTQQFEKFWIPRATKFIVYIQQNSCAFQPILVNGSREFSTSKAHRYKV
jgi:hypothetical protein